MKLNVSFTSLWAQVRRVTDEVDDIDLGSNIRDIDPIDLQLGEGLEVKLEDLGDAGGLLEYKGRQVLLYIPDHGKNIEEVLAGRKDGKRIHVCDCKTLVDMRKRKRFDRYFATTDLSGEFKISGESRNHRRKVEGTTSLYVCINCLKKLNYKNSESGGKAWQVRDSFDIQEFFETYSSCFTHLPKERVGPTTDSTYTKDWKDVSARKRKSVNYICEGCQIDLTSYKRLLHTHHIDGQKGNNRSSNLKALCVDCHRKEPLHSSMFVKHKDMMLITKLRRERSIIKKNWESALEHADPALIGAFGLLRDKGWSAPEVGYEVVNNTGEVIAALDAAWPEYEVGLYIGTPNKSILPSWTLYGLSDVINNIEQIQ